MLLWYMRLVGFFLFKQKTAYEMRISDWSSDVCSSDLIGDRSEFERHQIERLILVRLPRLAIALLGQFVERALDIARGEIEERLLPHLVADARCRLPHLARLHRVEQPADIASGQIGLQRPRRVGIRSEEHTSELQSLMRISYAVFCLKKKKKNN